MIPSEESDYVLHHPNQNVSEGDTINRARAISQTIPRKPRRRMMLFVSTLQEHSSDAHSDSRFSKWVLRIMQMITVSFKIQMKSFRSAGAHLPNPRGWIKESETRLTGKERVWGTATQGSMHTETIIPLQSDPGSLIMMLWLGYPLSIIHSPRGRHEALSQDTLPQNPHSAHFTGRYQAFTRTLTPGISGVLAGRKPHKSTQLQAEFHKTSDSGTLALIKYSMIPFMFLHRYKKAFIINMPTDHG